MDIRQALEIHFENLNFATPYDKNELEELKRSFYKLYNEGMFDFEEERYMVALSPAEFFQNLLIDAVNNITRRNFDEPLSNFTQRQIDKIPFTSDYENIARLCLNINNLDRYYEK